jgi:hypothetical protein
MTRRSFWPASLLCVLLAAIASAQTPQPFPKPGDPARPQPGRPPANPPANQGLKVLPPEQQTSVAQPGEPNEQTLGIPIYPGAQFVTSYDAGKGQRYYLFGTITDFPQIVAYYRTVLKQRGDLVFEMPPLHMFEVARFREETMAFPPSVTVKDYTWGGSEGYLNPKRGAAPARFRTIIQIVPPPPLAAPSK